MYEVYSTTLSEKGQIVIPKKAREKSRFKKGNKIILVVENGRIYLEKSNKTAKKVIDDFKDIQHITEKNLKELWDNKDDEVWNQYLK
ncbi:MAG: AbrB/MazE/SpoVT family DNA-binding domain-containing protein [Candidatus Diapherotrites archaeon]